MPISLDSTISVSESTQDASFVNHSETIPQSEINTHIEQTNLTKEDTFIEPILDPKNRKFTAYPIQYKNIWNKYKDQVACFWKAEQIDISNDFDDFQTLSSDEKHFIEMILAFFAASDGLVNFNLSERFINEIQISEILFTYQFQAMMENIHCVSADTQILTDNGYFKIVDLLNCRTRIWNGNIFANTFVQFTGNSELYRVQLSNGSYLDCTPYHKWFISSDSVQQDATVNSKTVCEKKKITFTKDLNIGFEVLSYNLPLSNFSDPFELKYPYLQGFFSGCGTSSFKHSFVHSDRHFLLSDFDLDWMTHPNNGNKSCDITKFISQAVNFVPLNFSNKVKLLWLQGFFDSLAEIRSDKENNIYCLQLNYSDFDFLSQVQLLLTTLGIKCCVSKNNNTFSLQIFSYELEMLYKLGFVSNFLSLNRPFAKSQPLKLYISDIQKLDGIHKTYCFNEPIEHAGIFNGILTGQSETYSLMLDNLVKDPMRKDYLLNSMKNVPAIKLISDWTFKWIESDKPFAYRVVAFGCVEAIFFSGPFAGIFWLKIYRNKTKNFSKGRPFMDGLMKSNKFIARDEGLHTMFACEIYKLLVRKLTQEQVEEIIKDSVVIAKNFMIDAIPVKLIGMNQDLMCEYIEYIADRLIVMLGYEKIFNTANPFNFMEAIGLDDKTNFFESRPHEYQDANVKNDQLNFKFVILDDF